MSESSLAVEVPRTRPHSNFEQAIFDASPFGTLATTALIFLLLLGSFATVTGIDGYAPFAHTPQGWILRPGMWPGFVLSLLITVALGMQRYDRQRDKAERAALQAVMPQCDIYEARMSDAEALGRRRLATAIGVLLGALPTLMLVPVRMLAVHPAMFIWFVLVNAFVAALFARGVAMSARGGENWARAIDQGLSIDLLRIDSLNVIGRQSARKSLIWFSVAGVILLLLVGHNGDALTLAVLLLAAVMGIWIFVRPMERVHRQIGAAKRAELDSIRHVIQAACTQAPHDPAAAAKLQGLLAYETRIESVREWPFDQTTAMRVAIYVFIPAIPWFGQAFAQRLIDTVAK
jgi:hypothetical protein